MVLYNPKVASHGEGKGEKEKDLQLKHKRKKRGKKKKPVFDPALSNRLGKEAITSDTRQEEATIRQES